MELLRQLYKVHSPSGNEKAMKRFVRKYIKRHIPDVKIRTDRKGNLYIIKGVAETYPCIAAHLDQVQREHSKDFTLIETKGLIFGYSPRSRKQEGLGADDKNGIWIALKCLEKYDTLKVVFFVEEETGCQGSNQADMDFFMDCRFVIQPDRRGYKDLIANIGWMELCSGDFLKATGYESFGYKTTEGLMTDILTLKERGLGISCINLSCGYYEPHTDNEFTVKKDLLNCLKLVEHIIENCTDVYLHTYDIYREKRKRTFFCDDEYGEAVDEIFGMLDMDDSLSVDDLKYMYGFYFPHLRREDFERIYLDYFEWKREEAEERQDAGDFEFVDKGISVMNGILRGKDSYEKGSPGEYDFIKEFPR